MRLTDIDDLDLGIPKIPSTEVTEVNNEWAAPVTPPPGTPGTLQLTMDDLEAEYGATQCTFADLEQITKSVVGAVKTVDIDDYRRQIDEMTVDLSSDPTTFQLMEQLSIIQGYKDRLTTMLNAVDTECAVRKCAVDMLLDANQAVSNASSADKRRGEAKIRWPVLIMRYEIINAFRSELTAILNNMRSRGDSVSRQVSLIDMQIRLGEYRRKSPDELKANPGEEAPDYKSGAPNVWGDVQV